MYEFIDTIEQPSMALPAEALSINGEYIENQIPGYRTLNVSGRELLSKEVTTEEVGRRNGTVYRSRRYPERTITVNYQLKAESNDEFRRYFEKLNSILDVEQAELIFSDDPEFFFVGTPGETGDIEPGHNFVTGSFNIVCADPFKRSVEEKVAEPNDDGIIIIDYHGNFPSYPILEADFYKSASKNNTSGKCGYVAYLNQNAKVLQFGNPEITEEIMAMAKEVYASHGQTVTSQQLITEAFNSTSGWAVNGGTTADSTIYTKAGTIRAAAFDGETDLALRPNSYGSGTKVWHGPTASITIPADSQSASSHKDWTLYFALKFAAIAATQKGSFQAFVTDSSGNVIAGIEIIKSTAGSTKGTIKFYIAGSSGVTASWTDVDLSEYNSLFGKNDGSPEIAALGPRARARMGLTTATRGITIKKSGSTISFTVGNRMYASKHENLANASKVSFYFGQYDSDPAISEIGVYSCKFTSNSVTKTWSSGDMAAVQSWITQDGIFGTNDILIADCADASVWLKDAYDDEEALGVSSPSLGALGNEWEEFALITGKNYIGTQYSDWVADAYAPTFKMRYREVFL